jgi:Holliday junction resolvasome RuvABC endonuclease subunit
VRLIGLDPGLASFGVAVVRLEPVRAVVEAVRVIRTQPSAKKRRLRKSDDTADRCRQIFRELAPLVTGDVVALCCEATALPFGRVQTSVVSALGRVRGLVDALAEMHGLPVLEEGPMVLKRLTTGSKSASKEEVRERLQVMFPELVTMWPPQQTLREHAGDAVAAVIAGLQSDVVLAARRAVMAAPA